MTIRRLVVSLVVLAVVAVAPLRADDRDAFMGLADGGGLDITSVDVQTLSEVGPRGEPDITDQQLRGRWILLSKSLSVLSVQQRVARFHINDSLTIPETGVAIPKNLWTVETGFNYSRSLGERRGAGVRANVGSASDRVFDSLQEVVFGVTAYYRTPSGPRNAWMFFLNYSNNRHFLNNIPLPGVGYYVESASKKVHAIIGLPFAAVFIKPTDEWDIRGTLFGPRRVSVETGYRFLGRARFYTSLERSSTEWLRSDRDNADNRLVFDRRRTLVGLQTPLVHGLRIDVSGGREIHRRFFENDSSASKGVPALDLRPAWLAGVKATVGF